MLRFASIPIPTGLRRIAQAALDRSPKVPSQPSAPQHERLPATARADGLDFLAGVVRGRERLALIRDDLLPADVRAANLRAAAEALEASGVEYGIVPDSGPVYRVAIPPGNRSAVLEAYTAAFGGQAFCTQLLDDAGEIAVVPAEVLPRAVADAECKTGRTVKGIRLFRPVATSSRTLRYGAGLGCDIEFWDPSASGEGGVASLRETPYGWWVPSMAATVSRRIGDREYPVVDVFAGRFPDDIDFPIDAVITWVDSSDPAWRERRDSVNSADLGGAQHFDDAEHRYRDRGELRYCLRSIAAYAPWIRRVFLVTDRQTPAWLDTAHPQVTVVDHRDLFTDPGHLPVFNSHAIESQLHRIPALSEHFLYFNDDIFLGRPQQPQQYFLPSGLPRVFHDRRAIPPGLPSGDDDVFNASQRATRHAIEEVTGRTYPYILAHTPYPLTRSLYSRVEQRLPGRLEDTGRSAFRSATDLAPVTLASHLGLAEGHAVSGELTHLYFSTDSREQMEQLPDLLEARNADAFCLADESGAELSPSEQCGVVTEFLAAYFPVPSPYETR
ncbi:stealth family protein [Streptomyces virginiae]|uniref:stealth family protein n=1 Tax=Streptomyces virginiae TaxID=1961 RepID=UPI003251211C